VKKSWKSDFVNLCNITLLLFVMLFHHINYSKIIFFSIGLVAFFFISQPFSNSVL